jgi:hypothetical protein
MIHYTIWIPNIKHGLKTQRKASHIRKDETCLPYLRSDNTADHERKQPVFVG